MNSNNKSAPVTPSRRQWLVDNVIPRTRSARIAWVSGVVIMLLSGFHFIVEYAPTIFPSLLHDHTALTDFIYSLDVSYGTSGLTFVAGAILIGAAHSLPGANPRTNR